MEFFLVFNGGMKKKERVATGMKKFILKFDESIFFSWPLAAGRRGFLERASRSFSISISNLFLSEPVTLRSRR